MLSARLIPTLSRLLAGLLLAVVTVLAIPTQAQDTSTPTAAVRSTVDTILEILRRPDFNLQQARPEISTEVRRAFDSVAMAQSVLSTNWRQASESQQKEFTELLMQTIEATYIGRLQAYSGETVEYRGEEINGQRAEVSTAINSDGTEIPLIYKLRERRDGWFVYDVEIENVSMVSTYRETYRSVVRRSGMSGLLEQMRDKIAELEASQKA